MGNVVRWTEKWLEYCQQKLVTNGKYSKWSGNSGGIPQGSVLESLLFIININDSNCNLNSRIAKFADDTKLGQSAAQMMRKGYS